MQHRRHDLGLVTIKADMERAYDKMKWTFLFIVMRCFGFSEKWIQLISQCLSTVSYLVLLNGCPYGLIKPLRGLRQRDPLSPFLFLIGTDVLSRLIMRAKSVGLIHGIKISRAAPPISHLLFADDTMFFSRASAFEASTVVNIINTYKGWSGQTINLRKSSISFSKNVPQADIDLLSTLISIDHVVQLGPYLGLPFILPRSKRHAFSGAKRQAAHEDIGMEIEVIVPSREGLSR